MCTSTDVRIFSHHRRHYSRHPLFYALIIFDLDADGRVDWGKFFFSAASPRRTASRKEEVLGETGRERPIPKAILHT